MINPGSVLGPPGCETSHTACELDQLEIASSGLPELWVKHQSGVTHEIVRICMHRTLIRVSPAQKMMKAVGKHGRVK